MKTKICTRCEKRKLFSEFHKQLKGKYGLSSRCKICVKNYDRKHYQIYKNEENERCKKYYRTHKIEHAECAKKYYQTHKVEAIKRMKKWRKTIIGCLRCRFNNIKWRCNNPKDKSYKYYGGRGIKCLFKSSQEFINYVMDVLKVDPRGLTIDRIDNNGHYEPGNIRFVTQAENLRNRGNYGE